MEVNLFYEHDKLGRLIKLWRDSSDPTPIAEHIYDAEVIREKALTSLDTTKLLSNAVRNIDLLNKVGEADDDTPAS